MIFQENQFIAKNEKNINFFIENIIQKYVNMKDRILLSYVINSIVYNMKSASTIKLYLSILNLSK
jgi:hypothetical protein